MKNGNYLLLDPNAFDGGGVPSALKGRVFLKEADAQKAAEEFMHEHIEEYLDGGSIAICQVVDIVTPVIKFTSDKSTPDRVARRPN